MPKILVADDSIAVRKVAERLLTEAGLGVALAANGEEAFAYLAKERPDVIVSDVIMPDKSGYEVCAFVRGHSSLSSTPVLLISGIVNSEVTKQADLCRANGVLKKPFQGTSLKDRVLELLAKQQEESSHAIPRPGTDQSGQRVSDAGRIQAAQSEVPEQVAIKFREMEEQLRIERARTEVLSKQVATATEQLASTKEQEQKLIAAHRRVTELEAQLAKLGAEVMKVSALEAALKAEQDAVRMLKLEVATLQQGVDRIPELESALQTERVAAEQLVQQLADVERVAARVTDAESRVASDERRTAQLMEQVRGLETALTREQQKVKETMQRLEDAQRAFARVEEVEALVEAERERNGLLLQRVSEAEQAAEAATKRFEEMARKLAEIANLASQLGSGKG